MSKIEKIEISAETVVELKTRKLSINERNEDNKVIRKGKNLSGNQPFRKKIYAITSICPDTALIAAPNQVQLIVRFMRDTKIEGTGGEIIEAAIAAGMLRTKIDPPVLFAYYRKLMENLGLEQIG
jgi:hypothetical protein